MNSGTVLYRCVVMKAVLITGNPKYINNKVAKDYYKSIVDFVNSLGG